jgi:hypothetical protein
LEEGWIEVHCEEDYTGCTPVRLAIKMKENSELLENEFVLKLNDFQLSYTWNVKRFAS